MTVRRSPGAVVVVVAAALALAGGAAARRSLDDARARLVAAQHASAAATRRADRLAAVAVSERAAAGRAQIEEAALGARVAAAAADLQAARARAAIVATLLAAQRERLALGQAPAARLFGALATMARRPTVALLAQPGSIADQVHLRAMLARTLPVVRARTAGLRDELLRSRQLQADAGMATTALRASVGRLEGERTALARLEADHRRRAERLGRSALTESDRALALGERARDLVDRLGEQGRAEAGVATLAALAGPLPRPLAPDAVLPAPPHGVYRLPVDGRLVTGLGEVSAAGVRARGLTLAVAAGARVVAPAAGRVSYAGRFRGYGVIVIIDHGGGWSTLLTGLGEAAVVAGKVVAAGAAIGTVAAGDEPRVTVELRRRGEPVDIAALVG